jgi:hypothetical protein
VIVDGCTFKRNKANDGGAIASYLTNGGSLIVRGGTVIEANEAQKGAAIYTQAFQLELHDTIMAANVATEEVDIYYQVV